MRVEAHRKEESKTFRQYPQNRNDAAIYDDAAANYMRVAMEFALEQLVGKNNSIAILRPEQAPQSRTGAGYILEISGDIGEDVMPGAVDGSNGIPTG